MATASADGGKPGTAGYYNELANYAVRFTFSGDYYHSAPWSVIDTGTTNVFHGCVNLPPSTRAARVRRNAAPRRLSGRRSRGPG